jgi:hypothetical protein
MSRTNSISAADALGTFIDTLRDLGYTPDEVKGALILYASPMPASPPPAPQREPLTGWQPIETAPDDELVVVFYLQTEGDEESDMHTLDFKEDGVWAHHNDHYEHYCAVAKGGCDVEWIGPSEKAPYTHWKSLGSPAAPGNGSGIGQGGE